jgi:hypothetical protein
MLVLRVLATTTLLLSLLNSTYVSAIETGSPNFRVTGFGTLGLSKTDNDLIGSRDIISQDGIFDSWSFDQVSKLGIQLDYTLSDRLQFGTQLLAKKRDYDHSFNDTVNSAYLNFKLSPDFSIRLGRVGQDIFMVSDYREAGYSQVWAHTPTELYSQLSTLFKDGVQLRHTKALGDGQLLSKFSLTKAESISTIQGKVDEFEFEPNFDLSIEWENNNWRLRFSHSRAKMSITDPGISGLQNTLTSAAASGWTQITPFIDDFDPNDKRLKYYSAGIAYQNNGWLIQSELSHSESDFRFIDNINNGYLLVGKNINDWTPFVMFAQSKSERFSIPQAPIFLTDLQTSVQNLVNLLPIDQKTISIGTRWDITSDIALKTQWDRTWVDPYGSYLFDVKSIQANKETVNRYTLTVDFVF